MKTQKPSSSGRRAAPCYPTLPVGQMVRARPEGSRHYYAARIEGRCNGQYSSRDTYAITGSFGRSRAHVANMILDSAEALSSERSGD